MSEIIKKCIAVRESTGMSVKTFSELLGKNYRDYVHKIENGICEYSISELSLFSKWGLNLNWLAGDATYMWLPGKDPVIFKESALNHLELLRNK